MTTTEAPTTQHYVVLTKNRLDYPGDPAAELRVIECQGGKAHANATADRLFDNGRVGGILVVQATSPRDARAKHRAHYVDRYAFVQRLREQWSD